MINNKNVFNERNYYFDNLKVLLIFLVVFGHLIEHLGIKYVYIYKIIYIFHIPLFTFCSGYFSYNQTPKKILSNIIYPYFVFQTLYCLFNIYILKADNFIVDFTTPYWIMWYMLSLLLWNGILILYKQTDNIKVIISIIISFIFGIIAGKSPTTGYYISLSRTLVFFPFFLLGYYFRYYNLSKATFMSNKYIPISVTILSLFICIYIYLNPDNLIATWLYGSAPYSVLKYTFVDRILIYICSIILSIMVMIITPKKKFFLSYIGKYTITVYLLHGFIIKMIYKYKLLAWVSFNIKSLAILCLISLSIILLLSSKPVFFIFKPLTKLTNINLKKHLKKKAKKINMI